MQQVKSLHNLHDLISGFSNVHVLCIGDVMLDRFIYGKVDRISPEAPVPVFHIQRETQSLGGAGNVVQNLASLGTHVSFISAVGADYLGSKIEEHLQALADVDAQVVKVDNRTTTLKIRFIAGGQQLIRADKEQSIPIDDNTIAEIKNYVTDKISQVSLIVLSDYGKGVLQPHLIQWIIDTAHRKGKKVLIDPKGSDYTLYAGCDVITPNAKELSQATSMPTAADDQVIKAAQQLSAQHHIKSVIITRSEKGISVFDPPHDDMHIPTDALEVFDVSGAGDTVIAVIAACVAQGASLTTAAVLANMAAGLVVAKVGTASLTTTELLQKLDDSSHSLAHNKMMSCDQGLQSVIEWHRKGLRVGFTNGCFDLLHPGHISLIQQAKKSCDRLIIGLNSDSSVKRLKGLERPMHNESARGTILSALLDVDAVIVFDEDTPLRLIQKLRPDVLIKGADYTVEQIAGARDVLSWGGEVVLANLEAGFSTTSTIKKFTKAS